MGVERDDSGMRHVEILPNVLDFASGSAEVRFGRTRVICAASIEERVPGFLAGTGQGWVTAEYSMLPAATPQRSTREAVRGKQGGRTMEIQRLIGRSLRAVTNLELLGERTVTIDCDVLQADGGTRCASITGGFVALALAIASARDKEALPKGIITDSVSSVSVGLKNGMPVIDPDYELDSNLDVDANFVVTGSGGIVEVQATAEGMVMNPEDISRLVAIAVDRCRKLAILQAEAIEEARNEG